MGLLSLGKWLARQCKFSTIHHKPFLNFFLMLPTPHKSCKSSIPNSNLLPQKKKKKKKSNLFIFLGNQTPPIHINCQRDQKCPNYGNYILTLLCNKIE